MFSFNFFEAHVNFKSTTKTVKRPPPGLTRVHRENIADYKKVSLVKEING